MKRITGSTWQALLSTEHYGPHFTVSGRMRLPNDREIAEAKEKFPEAEYLVEIENPVAVNPYVRHFMSRDAALKMGLQLI